MDAIDFERHCAGKGGDDENHYRRWNIRPALDKFKAEIEGLNQPMSQMRMLMKTKKLPTRAFLSKNTTKRRKVEPYCPECIAAGLPMDECYEDYFHVFFHCGYRRDSQRNMYEKIMKIYKKFTNVDLDLDDHNDWDALLKAYTFPSDHSKIPKRERQIIIKACTGYLVSEYPFFNKINAQYADKQTDELLRETGNDPTFITDPFANDEDDEDDELRSIKKVEKERKKEKRESKKKMEEQRRRRQPTILAFMNIAKEKQKEREKEAWMQRQRDQSKNKLRNGRKQKQRQIKLKLKKNTKKRRRDKEDTDMDPESKRRKMNEAPTRKRGRPMEMIGSSGRKRRKL